MWVSPQGQKSDRPVLMEDVKNEVEALRVRHGIHSIRSKVSTMKYAFEREDVPSGDVQVLEVRYQASQPQLPSDLEGQTFTHVFGRNTSPLETLLMKLNLMGPGWLRVSGFSSGSRHSWCRYEVHVNGLKNLQKVEGSLKQEQMRLEKAAEKKGGGGGVSVGEPTMKVLAVHLKTVMNHKDHANEIVMASLVLHPSVNISGNTDAPDAAFQYTTLVRKFDAGENMHFPPSFTRTYARGGGKTAMSHLRVCNSERELLNLMLATIQREDPDVYCGHAFVSFDLDVLLHRMHKLDIKTWSKLGRLRRNKMPKLQAGPGGMNESTWDEKQVIENFLILYRR